MKFFNSNSVYLSRKPKQTTVVPTTRPGIC